MLQTKNIGLTAFLIVAMSLAPSLAVPVRSSDVSTYALEGMPADQAIAFDSFVDATRVNTQDELDQDPANWLDLDTFAEANNMDGQDAVDEDPANWDDIDMFNIQEGAQMDYTPAAATDKAYEIDEYDYEQDIFGHIFKHLVRHGHRIMRHVVRHAPRLINHLKKHIVRHGGRVFKHIKKHLVHHAKKIFKKLGGRGSSVERGKFEAPKIEPKQRPPVRTNPIRGSKPSVRPSLRPKAKPASDVKGAARHRVSTPKSRIGSSKFAVQGFEGRWNKGKRIQVDSEEEEYSSALAHEIIMAILNIENAGPEDGFVGLDAEDIGEFDESADSDRKFENLLLDFILNAE